jgi:succinate dehydrogenase / fumarate reductase flavoprotein subunit
MANVKGIMDLVVKTDVLVVGGGGAGASAAVAARRANAEVTLAAKGGLGKSGNTIMASASVGMDGESAYRFGEKKADRKFTKDVLFERIVKGGFYLSEQDLASQYVEEAAKRVQEFIQLGRRAKQRFMFLPPGSWFTSGRAIGLACRQGVLETPGIDVVEDVIICDLIKKEDKVIGALGVNVYTGELVAFQAKAVVLCTGGYQPFSFKCTHSGTTGDGMAMAYRAGAMLADMEFLLFLPGVLLSPQFHRGSIFPFIWYVAGFARPEVMNGAGDRITDHMSPELLEMAEGSEWVKLVYTYFWGKDIAAGRGTANGGVHFDFSKLSRWRYFSGAFKAMVMLKQWYRKSWRYQGEDMSDLNKMALKGIPWEVGLSSEYSMGGIIVDAQMWTGVPGLFAGGEVTSGVFGASRMARALTEMLVQGHRAGVSAAAYARQVDSVEIGVDQLAETRERILRPFNQKSGISPSKVHAAIESAADAGFAFVREEIGLRSTLQEIERIRDENMPRMALGSQARAYNYEWIESMQAQNLITCVEAGVKAALMRRESRGFHIRTDCPEVDNNNWVERIIVSEENGRMAVTKRKPVFTTLAPHSGKHANIMHYAVECEKEIKNYNPSNILDE